MDISRQEDINIKDKRIAIIGMARSGIAAAQLAAELGADVFISDHGQPTTALQQLNDLGIAGEIGGHSTKIYDADLWVISPGVPQDANIVTQAKSKHIPIISEIEFASWFTKSPILAITGSNGKTTTAHMLYEMCKSDAVRPSLSGNVGHPFAAVVKNDLRVPDPKRVYVVEISSFQMEFIQHFKPFIALILNLSPNHLNRYANMDDYIQAKMNMWSNQTKHDILVFNGDDKLLTKHIAPAKAQKIPFSLKPHSTGLFTLNATKIVDKEHATLINLDQIALPGRHNLANFLGAATVASLLGIASSKIKAMMKKFYGIPHRLEKVKEIDGITFINDSKATNIEAVKVALESFSKPIFLILGGQNKSEDFQSLIPHIHNVKEVFTMGESERIITAALGDTVILTSCGNLKNAVATAYVQAQPGDIVLLSPGCASFDQFNNFEERGEEFKQLVNTIGCRA